MKKALMTLDLNFSKLIVLGRISANATFQIIELDIDGPKCWQIGNKRIVKWRDIYSTAGGGRSVAHSNWHARRSKMRPTILTGFT